MDPHRKQQLETFIRETKIALEAAEAEYNRLLSLVKIEKIGSPRKGQVYQCSNHHIWFGTFYDFCDYARRHSTAKWYEFNGRLFSREQIEEGTMAPDDHGRFEDLPD